MNLIFLCPTKKRPVGGIKMIYKMAEAMDCLLPQGSQAYLLHPNTIFFRSSWFKTNIKFIRKYFGIRWAGKISFSDVSRVFDPNTDFVIIPELWVRKYAAQLHRAGVQYGIFVQNGYLIGKGRREELSAGYQNAGVILSVSDDASSCIETAFAGVAEKIVRIHFHLDAEKFRPADRKENIITYMPRKLSEHFNLLKFFVGDRLPGHWKFMSIDGFTEDETATLLGRSKIFLSFSHQEGLGLPPIEAALAGNYVIGYTGEAGKEFWHDPLFTEIEHGNFLKFADVLLNQISLIDKNNAADIAVPRQELISRFSLNRQENDLRVVLGKITLLYKS